MIQGVTVTEDMADAANAMLRDWAGSTSEGFYTTLAAYLLREHHAYRSHAVMWSGAYDSYSQNGDRWESPRMIENRLEREHAQALAIARAYLNQRDESR